MRYLQGSWSVDLPDGWETSESEDCTAIYNPDGVGAFHISSYIKTNAQVSLNDLHEFASATAPAQIETPSLHGLFEKTAEDGNPMYQWWFCHSSQVIYVTYTCAAQDEASEAKEREHIVQSLRSHYEQASS